MEMRNRPDHSFRRALRPETDFLAKSRVCSAVDFGLPLVPEQQTSLHSMDLHARRHKPLDCAKCQNDLYDYVAL